MQVFIEHLHYTVGKSIQLDPIKSSTENTKIAKNVKKPINNKILIHR